MTQRVRRRLVAGLVALALAAAVVLAARRWSARALPADPLAYVPRSARVLAVLDLAALRRSPRLASWLSSSASRDGASCEAVLARRVRTLLVVAARWPVDDFALVLSGDLPRDALLRCAMRRAGAANEVARERYRGLDLVRVAPRWSGSPALRPPPVAEVVYLPSGVVLAGAGELVRHMVDQGFDHASVTSTPPLLELARRPGHGRPVALALWREVSPGDDAEVLGRHVVGVGAGLALDPGLELRALLACDAPAGAQRVGEALQRIRDGRDPAAGPLLRWLLQGAALRTAGAEVELRASPDPRLLDELLQALGALLAPPRGPAS